VHAFHADADELILPAGHPFPASKTRLLREAVARHLPQLRALEARPASDGELALAHEPAWIAAVSEGTTTAAQQREIGFPWSERMVQRSRRSVGATICAARTALLGMAGGGPQGVAANFGGGTHHADAHKGAGYCVFNDVAVAARLMQAEHHRRHAGQAGVHGLRVLVIDLDVALADGCGDAAYLEALDAALARAFEAMAEAPPRLAFYLAGADAHENDRLGRLALSREGLAERDRRVFAALYARRIPVALTMAGGYGRDIAVTVAIHQRTLALALDAWRAWQARREREQAEEQCMP